MNKQHCTGNASSTFHTDGAGTAMSTGHLGPGACASVLRVECTHWRKTPDKCPEEHSLHLGRERKSARPCHISDVQGAPEAERRQRGLRGHMTLGGRWVDFQRSNKINAGSFPELGCEHPGSLGVMPSSSILGPLAPHKHPCYPVLTFPHGGRVT